MNDKEFGIKFTKTDNGFKIEVNGNEELVNAHKEMGDAWKEFMGKARDVAKAHHQQYHKHAGHHGHPGHPEEKEHGCCCDHQIKEEVTDIKSE